MESQALTPVYSKSGKCLIYENKGARQQVLTYVYIKRQNMGHNWHI